MIKIKYTGTNKPERQTIGSAGIDLYNSGDEVIINPGEKVTIHTGVYSELPVGTVGILTVRSSTGTKKHLCLANTMGVIDSDYRGEIMAVMYNYGDEPVKIEANERILQYLILNVYNGDIVYTDNLSETQRGDGGFGSTGKK